MLASLLRYSVIGVLTTSILMVSGCGSKTPEGPARYPVTGSVTLNGKPLESGRILFESRDKGVGSTADLGKDGTFQVEDFSGKGLPAGEYAVAILPPNLQIPLGPIPPEIQKQLKDFPVPAKFRDPKTSQLKATIESGPAAKPLLIDIKP